MSKAVPNAPQKRERRRHLHLSPACSNHSAQSACTTSSQKLADRPQQARVGTGGYSQPRFGTGLTGKEEQLRPKCPCSACLSSSAELQKVFTALVGIIRAFCRKWNYRGREALQFSLKMDRTVTDVLASSRIQLHIQVLTLVDLGDII